jgi:UDP-MurNAc hydroxylase
MTIAMSEHRGPTMRWLNHAGFALANHDHSVVLVCDPWTQGAAFNNGWDLMLPTPADAIDWSTVTHIWLSHEHPDHFSPPSLKAIPADLRANICVLYRQHGRGRVLQWCERAGFATRALDTHSWISLGRGFDIMVGAHRLLDSWVAMHVDGHTVLNTNDCVIERDAEFSVITQLVGKVDVLMAQFSYANRSGNPEQVELRHDAAQRKLDALARQITQFHAPITIPFASFIHFSHQENSYLNDARVSVAQAAQRIGDEGSHAVILCPGDEWDLAPRRPGDNDAALARYGAATDQIPPLHHSVSVAVGELQTKADGYVRRLNATNTRALLIALARVGRLPPVTIKLWDAADPVFFNPLRGLTVAPGTASDVEMHSDSLAFMLDNDFGIQTLEVNGRVKASTPNGFDRLEACFSIGLLNSSGRALSPRLLLEWPLIVRKVRSLVHR